ncbi:unnamed protein product [Macrosiphum euphorbiae]|uniref:Uncharacterized protein n=1 Tax=Macrosiphum euphorbiae TaxID=13131 RepID=A0AAV0XQR3_9HEMI|nr:unnamed protein product [Macrosiphum euphorbiae]
MGSRRLAVEATAATLYRHQPDSQESQDLRAPVADDGPDVGAVPARWFSLPGAEFQGAPYGQWLYMLIY